MARLTLGALHRMGACSDARDAFRERFPKGAPLHRVIAALADHPDGIEWWGWLSEVMPELAPAWAEYERVTAPARAEYERVTAPARAEYERVRDTAWAEYERVTAPARAEYERVRDTARAEYERVTAPARAEYERVRDTARAEYEQLQRAELRRIAEIMAQQEGAA